MELLHLLFFFFIPLLLLWFKFLHHSTGAGAGNLPPGPWGLPIVGSLFKLGPQPHKSLANLAALHGPLITLHLGSITTIVASSPETAKEILQTHDRALSNRTVHDVITAQPNPDSTIAWVAADHRWRRRRQLCNTHLFSKQSLNSLQHLRHRKAEQLVTHIRKQYYPTREPVDIGRVVFGTTLNLVSNTVFSEDVVDPGFESAEEFKEVVWRIMEDAGKPNMSDYFPAVRRWDLQGIKRHIRGSYMRLHQIFDGVIEKRVKERRRYGDFLDVLLDRCEQDEDGDGSEFNLQTIKPFILDLFIAGSDTSAITTEWAMAELVHNSHAMHKAREELNQTIGKQRLLNESDIDQLPYLRAIVKETMRLHPAVPLLLPHKARNDVVLLGYTIPKDSQVLVNVWAIGRDPKYWDNPLLFRPERFLGSTLDFRGPDFEYLPFGAGRRICPGLSLAVRMVHLMVGSLLQSFSWRLPDGMLPEDMNMEEQFGVTLKKAVPLKVVPILN